MAQKVKLNYKQYMGAWGEDQAAEYLTKQGLTVLARNYRTRAGEIDLIASDGDELVFVEVKARSNLEFGYPEEAVTPGKLSHIQNAAEEYLAEHFEVAQWRIDVVAIQGKPENQDPQIEWFKEVG